MTEDLECKVSTEARALDADSLSRLRSNGSAIDEEESEINLNEVSHQIDEMRGFTPYKNWLMKRQLFFVWKNEEDPEINDPAKVLRTYLVTEQENDQLCTKVRYHNDRGDVKFHEVQNDGLIMRKAPNLP
jgi:hypothetical protein